MEEARETLMRSVSFHGAKPVQIQCMPNAPRGQLGEE
jgi:hypothetical protein